MLTNAIGYATPVLINLFATPLLLQGLGESGYGLQNLVGVIAGYFAVLDMGLDISISKFLAEDHAHGDTRSQNRLLSTTLQLYVIVGLVGMVSISLSANFLARQVFVVPSDIVKQAIYVFILAGIGFFANILLSWGRAVVTGLQRFDLWNGVTITSNLISVGIGLGAVFAGYGVVGYVLARVTVSILSNFAYFFIIPRLLPSVRLYWGFDRTVLRRVRGYIGSGILIRIAGLLGNGLDRTLIGAWVGVAAVGVYAVPLLMVTSLSGLVSGMLAFTFPLSSELAATGRHAALQDVYIRSSRFIAALASIVFVPILVLGDVFLSLWIGPSTAAKASGVLYLLALAGYLGMFATTLLNFIVVATGHIGTYTIYALARAGTISLGYVLLIPLFGIEGAGVAVLLGNGIEWIFFTFALRRYLHIAPRTIFQVAYLRPLLLAAGMAGIAFLLRPLATSWVGLGLVVIGLEFLYVVAGFGMGVFGETEKRAVLGLWQMVRKSEQGIEERP